jgi:hypothetical protein
MLWPFAEMTTGHLLLAGASLAWAGAMAGNGQSLPAMDQTVEKPGCFTRLPHLLITEATAIDE